MKHNSDKILPDAENPLLSNRTAAGNLLDAERWLAADRVPPVDLRAVPREEWDRWLNFYLLLPPRLLDGFEPGPIPQESWEALEDAVARFHGIAEPYCVQMTHALKSTGHGWRYDPAAAPFATGFIFDGPNA